MLGISHIVSIGHHKGVATLDASVVDGTQYIVYRVRHLSEADFGDHYRRHLRQAYPTCYDVHAAPILKKNLGKLLDRTRTNTIALPMGPQPRISCSRWWACMKRALPPMKVSSA
ncbi:MAG: hypothetical protein ABI811_06755 [Acidobacteriota bacterium]